MNQKQLCALAHKIIENNQYMTIGSYQVGRGVWVSPVAYGADKQNNLYYIFLPHSQHAKNIRSHKRVMVTIFNSHQPFGEGVGLQIEGTVKTVSLPHLPNVLRIYLTRKWPYISNRFKTYLAGSKKVLNNHTYRAYQFTPTKIWMNDPESEVDRRVEVKLR
jgi:hypothetical protein